MMNTMNLKDLSKLCNAHRTVNTEMSYLDWSGCSTLQQHCIEGN